MTPSLAVLELVSIGAAGTLAVRAAGLFGLRRLARRAITGRARAPEPLAAPRSGRPCVCYDGRGGVVAADFLVDDGRRVVRVRAAGARFFLDGEPRPTDVDSDAVPPSPEERCIYPTEVVSVLGPVREEIDPDGSAAHPFREAPTRLAVLSSRRRPAIVLRGAPCDLGQEAGRAALLALAAAAFCAGVGVAIGVLLGA